MVFSLRPRLKVSLPGRAYNINNNLGGFAKNYKFGLVPNLTPEARARSMQGLYKTWDVQSRQRQGEKVVVLSKKSKKSKRKRLKLRETVAKEAREIQELARKNAQAAMIRVAQIAQTSPNETAALAASALLFERAYGKASQVNINASLDANGKATDVSQKELDTRIEKALERIDSLTRGAPKAPAREEPLIDLRKLDRDPDSTPLN
jgi:hypothetical protein